MRVYSSWCVISLVLQTPQVSVLARMHHSPRDVSEVLVRRSLVSRRFLHIRRAVRYCCKFACFIVLLLYESVGKYVSKSFE